MSAKRGPVSLTLEFLLDIAADNFQQIVERSGTLFFSFQALDSTKPAGSVKIRVETIAYYLQKYSASIIERKQQVSAPDCPLLNSVPDALEQVS